MADAYVVGIGEAAPELGGTESALDLALRSADNALTDAGLGRTDVDGVLSYGLYGDLVPAEAIAYGLGRDEVRVALDFHLGGQAPAMLIGAAAKLIGDGDADVVVISRAMLGRSGLKVGRAEFPRIGEAARRASGVTGYPVVGALWARRYLADADLGDDALAEAVLFASYAEEISTTKSRVHSAPVDFGPRPLPKTLSSYRLSSHVAWPLRTADCVSEVDGGVALVVASEAVAERLVVPPVGVLGAVWRSKQTDTDMGSVLGYEDMSRNVAWAIREALVKELSFAVDECQVLSIYDCFSSVLLQSIEGLGLAAFGRGPAYLRERRLGSLGGPWLNPGGGMLRRGYVHGMNNAADAVRALRILGTERSDSSVGLIMSGGMTSGSAVLLQTE